MKVYKALIIDKDTSKDILYECDVNKNKQCTKEHCQTQCKHTLDIQYAKDIYNEYMNNK